MNYEQAINYLLTLPDMERCSTGPAARTMSLAGMRALLRRAGNPELGRKTIHVTGSKGKGSTSSYIASILHESSLSTALYTSPHIHDYTERIALATKPVLQEEFARGLSELELFITGEHQGKFGPISTFGALTALFFYLAKKHQIQWQVVEVGLGGLLDATNVFEKKELAVITPVSLEHTAILGSTVAEIAANKAGIITPGCTTILAPQKDSSVLPVIARRCEELDSQLVSIERLYKIIPQEFDRPGQKFVLQGPYGTRQLQINMLGEHQLANATTAVAAVDVLINKGISIAEENIAKGLVGTTVPGRLEKIQDNPVVVLDGAHNRESMQALRCALKRHFLYDRLMLVLGVNSDKDIRSMLSILSEFCHMIVSTRSKSERAVEPAQISRIADELCLLNATTQSSIEALETALKLAGRDDLICVTGSLYLVAEAREYFMNAGKTNSFRLTV